MELDASIESEPETENSPEPSLLSQSIDTIISKIRGIMGVEFAEFGGIRRLTLIEMVHPTNIPSMLIEVQERFHQTLVRQVRQAITGDPDKRIRDSLNETHVQTRVKQVDAASFTLGVAVSYLTEWIVFRRPTFFPNFFYILMGILLFNRFFTYRATKEHFFMLDFCYAVQLSTWLQTLLCDASNEMCTTWYKANFALAHGPIAWAIIGWKNSLVFHSADKVTSFAIHIMPGMFHYLLRWEPLLNYTSEDPNHSLNNLYNADLFFYPVIIYIIWQSAYLFIQFTYLDQDPTLVTSLRFLVGTDSGKPATKWGYNIAKRIGFLKEGETLDPLCRKTTLLFAGCQMIYVLICLIPVPVFFYNQTLDEIFIILLILIGIWNGGSYYIQIFSQRYNEKFEKMQIKSE